MILLSSAAHSSATCVLFERENKVCNFYHDTLNAGGPRTQHRFTCFGIDNHRISYEVASPRSLIRKYRSYTKVACRNRYTNQNLVTQSQAYNREMKRIGKVRSDEMVILGDYLRRY